MRKSSDISTVDRIFSPHEDTGFRDYLRDRYDRTMEYLEKSSTKIGSSFLERAKKIFDMSNSEEALRRTRNAIRTVSNVRRANSIFEATSLEDLRTMGVGMQRFAMADPVIRAQYHKQRIDGYSDSYIDNEPGLIGKDHYDYRRSIDSVWMEGVDKDGEEIMTRSVFYEQLIEGDRERDPVEKFAILDTWAIQRMFNEAGFDTTNRLGGNLG